MLLAGTAAGIACAPPYGALLMDPTPLALVLPWGSIPGGGVLVRDVVLPGTVPSGVTVQIQQLGLLPGLGSGNLSNGAALTFE
jgi:hypothetical protein